MFGNNPFNLPLPQGVLKTLGAESKVFEQQGQQGGQGSQGYGPCEDNTPSNSDMREKYSDSTNEFYLYQVDNGWSNDVQIVQWSGSTPTEAIKRQYLSYLRYTNKVNRNALGGGCIPQAQANYANPGFVVLFPTTGLWGNKQDTNPNTGGRIFTDVWESAKAQHEGVFAGCMESTASNYNANAATDDGSCVWNWRPYQTNSLNIWGKPRTDKTTDGFRYFWEVDSMEVLSAYDAANSKLRGTWKITKVCESKPSCGVPSNEQDFSKRTLPTTIVSTGTIAHPNGVSFGSDWNTASNTAKAQGQTAIDSLFNNHVPLPCREGSPMDSNWSGSVPQPCDDAFSLTVKRSLIYCDGSGNDWMRAEYTLLKDGVAQQTWTVSNDSNNSLTLSNAMMAQQFNSSTGNYSWVDGAQGIVDAYESSQPTTTIAEDYKINNGWRRTEIPANKILDRSKNNFFLPWATRNLITNSCGTTIGKGPSYISIYRFTDTGILNAKPTATNENGKVVVKWKDEILTPYETLVTTDLTQAEEDALTEPYYTKIGCMDASAKNYDPEANTNAKAGGSSAACVWNCTETDGRGLMKNCRNCLADADGNLVDMVFDVSTNAWSCPATGSGGDPPLVEEPSFMEGEWLPFAAIGGLILLALGMG